MKISKKMVYLISLLSFTSLQANILSSLNSITLNWAIVAILSVLFFILLFSIIKDLKNTKKQINNIFLNQKSDNISNSIYLNDINNERKIATNNLKNSIKNLSNHSDKAILKELSKVYKDIFLTNKEESIFLAIANGEKIGKTECFKLSSLIEELKEYNIINNKDLVVTNEYIVANREIISNILRLLNKLQTKEHNLKRAKCAIDLDSKNGHLNIYIDKKLKLNSSIKSVLEQNIKPIFNSSDNKFWGIYLYLLKHLTNMINATLKINLNENNYAISIGIPIDIKHQTSNSEELKLLLKDPKRAIIVSNIDTSNKIAHQLKELNFEYDIKPIKELNKELPNFIEYDIAFIYSKTFEPILTDYLRTIKTYSTLKIVALVDSHNYLYPSKIVDKVINLDNLNDELYSSILELYRKSMVTKSEIREIATKDIATNKQAKVLIADDDIANLHILEYMFKEYGIKTTTVTNGVDALEMLNKEHYDLVVLDSIMPILDGYKTIEKIRENSEFNSTPIIIHTSFSIEESSMDKIFKLGFDSYLPKPFNKYDFKSLIERYIPVYQEPESLEKQETKNRLNKETLKEFIAIYGDSDKMLNRYIKEKRETQAFALIDDLREMATKIEANDFLELLSNIEENLKIKHEVDSSLMYKLSNNLHLLKKEIIKKLSA